MLLFDPQEGYPWCESMLALFDNVECGGTGFRGLTRGMATLPQGNQEQLVVKDKVGRPPGVFAVSKYMGCDIFSSVL